MKGKFITRNDLIQMDDRSFLYNSAPDSQGYYKSYWTINYGDIVFIVQNINI